MQMPPHRCVDTAAASVTHAAQLDGVSVQTVTVTSAFRSILVNIILYYYYILSTIYASVTKSQYS